jgi:hypothetical protein
MNPSVFGCAPATEGRLPVSDLAAYGLVPHEVQAFAKLLRATDAEAADPTSLSPLTTQALRAGLLGDTPGRWLVLAGATTGKSTLATLLLLHARHRGERALLLRYGRGRRRQTRTELSDIVSGEEARDAIASLRQLLRWLRSEPRRLREIDLLVIDDLDRLLHRRRAHALRRLVESIRVHAPGLPVVALADDRHSRAALSRIAEPLQAQVLYGPPAPVVPVADLASCAPRPESSSLPAAMPPLAQSRGAATEEQAQEALSSPPSRPPSESQRADALLRLARRGEPTLVLVPQRSQMLRLLHRLIDACERQALPLASRPLDALAELASTAPGHAQDLLRLSMRQGLALEGSELTRKQRRVVDRAQARGDVLLTLCHRLPARPVGRTRMQHIVILMPDSGPKQVAQTSQGSWLVNRQGSLAARLLRRLRPDGRLWVEGAASLRRDSEPRMQRGQRNAELSAQHRRSRGLAGFLRFVPAFQRAAESPFSSLEALTLVALAGPRLRLPLLLSERSGCDYASHLLLRAEEHAVSERPLFRWLAAQRQALDHEDLRAIKAVLLLDDWLAGARSVELEARYHIWTGQLVGCARCMARWLRRLHGSLATAASGRRPGVTPPLRVLIQRLQSADPDEVAEHRAALGRHIGVLLGAVHALDVGVTSASARLGRS